MIDPISGGTWRPSEIRKQEAMLQGIGLMPRRKTLVYGTMFAIRASLLIPIWRRYCEEDFAAPCSENPHRDYGLAGDLEIMFGLMVFAQGYYVSSCMLPVWTAPVFYPLKGALFRLMRFFSDAVRIMRNGHV